MINGEPSQLDVLLVEDNPSHAHLVVRTLAKHPSIQNIHHVEDGEAALHFLFREGQYADPETSPRPDLILLDLRLPKIDGVEVLDRVKSDAALKNIPVVVLTTSEDEKDIARVYDLFANSYLVKPVSYDDFAKLMDDLSHYWSRWNRTANEPG